MAKLDTIVKDLQKRLRVDDVPDYGGAVNGLQLRSAQGKVTRVGAAVDASLPVVEKAVSEGVDLLVVHHGMFWQGAQKIDGAVFTKLKVAMDAGLAIYSCHLPLDIHETLGNNILLARACGIKGKSADFLPWKGIAVGRKFTHAATLKSLVKRVEKAVGGAVHVCAAGPAKTKVIGVATGGAGSEIYAAAEAGIDTFITGEGPHHSYTSAEELGMNVIYAGHYATETFGVRAVADYVAKKYRVEKTFIDHPTGL